MVYTPVYLLNFWLHVAGSFRVCREWEARFLFIGIRRGDRGDSGEAVTERGVSWLRGCLFRIGCGIRVIDGGNLIVFDWRLMPCLVRIGAGRF